MNLVPFAVYDPLTGDILRAGRCQPIDLFKQPHKGEAVLEAEANFIEDRVVIPSTGAAPYVRRRSALSIAERQSIFRRPPGPGRLAVLLEAMRAKGVDITAADLAAARARLTEQA